MKCIYIYTIVIEFYKEMHNRGLSLGITSYIIPPEVAGVLTANAIVNSNATNTE